MRSQGTCFVVILVILILPLNALSVSPTFAQDYPEDPIYCDTYEGSWTGIRYINKNPGKFVTHFDQKVTSIGNYPDIGIGLTAHVETLDSWSQSSPEDPDVVELDVIASANGRKGIDYQIGDAPPSAQNIHSLLHPSVYDVSMGSYVALTGLEEDNGGVWVDLPLQVTFYGGAPTLSGTYTRMYVTSNGYVSFSDEISTGNPQFGPDLPNAVIAPFWRDLDPSAGGSIIHGWNQVTGMFYVGWINVPNKSNGIPQEFYMLIHRDEVIHGQNVIEFVYYSVTPDAGIPTVIGIEDQYGVRNTSYDQSLVQNGWDNRRRVSATSPPMYLSSLEIVLYDYEDASAAMEFDKNVMGGGNMKFKEPIDIEIGPRWLKTSLSAAAFVDPTGLILDGALLGIDCFELLFEHYANLEAAQIHDATKGESVAYLKAYCEERYGVYPTDASFALSFRWNFYDKCPDIREHRLLVTAIAGYSDSPHAPGGEQWFESTSVELCMTPGNLLRPYEGGGSGSNWGEPWDSNAQNGYDYWGLVESKAYTGGNSDWCAGHNDGTQGEGLYDNNMESYMETIWLGPQLQYSTLYLYFKAWVDTEPEHDWLSLECLDSRSCSWNELIGFSGRISTLSWRSHNASTEWLSVRATLPQTALKIRFKFYSDSQVAYQGVYLDQITLLGIPYTGTPKCAMKTSTAGQFYIPGAPLNPADQNIIMIHTLFGSDMVGDQSGFAPDTYPFRFPDGTVNIVDIVSVALAFGSSEGDPNWNYMADINPDGGINILDIVNIAFNFGNTGGYSADYSRVTVDFVGGAGGSMSPDLNGFVEIPEGATGFTVKYNGIPTGAMVIFFNP